MPYDHLTRSPLLSAAPLILAALLSGCVTTQVQQTSPRGIPLVLRGEWNRNPAACHSNPSNELEYPLIIEPGRFFMGDFSGVITRVVETAPGSFAVTATVSAEGDSSSETYRMTLASGGERLRVDDARTYYRCTP